MKLTPRQRLVCELTCCGINRRDIINILGISAYRVNYHLRQIANKLSIPKDGGTLQIRIAYLVLTGKVTLE